MSGDDALPGSLPSRSDEVDEAAGLVIVVATRNRRVLLEKALASIEVARAKVEVQVEVMVIDNDSTDSTGAFLEAWCRERPGRHSRFVAGPGKARALNLYLRESSADVFAFTDDDAVVAPDWIDALLRFFAAHPEYAGAAGPIRVPPEITDPELLRRIVLYPGLPFFEKEARVHDVSEFYGANAALRREVFDHCGYFDERLGPGALGLADDTELALRMVRSGLRLGYVSDAVVYHAVDEARLNLPALLDYTRRLARSYFVMNRGEYSMRHLALKVAKYRLLNTLPFAGVERSIEKQRKAAFYGELLRAAWQRDPVGREGA